MKRIGRLGRGSRIFEITGAIDEATLRFLSRDDPWIEVLKYRSYAAQKKYDVIGSYRA
jgi:hypothetical protein